MSALIFVMCVAIFVCLSIVFILTFNAGVKWERDRFEKEAVHHGYGTYVLVEDDTSEHGKYEFEWMSEVADYPFQPKVGV